MNGTRTVDSGSMEERVFRPMPQMVVEANLGPQELAAARARAEADPLAFWEDAARELTWFHPWERVLERLPSPGPHGSPWRWFPGARCNIVHNALDRHITTSAKNRLAIIWEGEPGDSRKYTYYELHREVKRFAGALASLGIGPGDRVAISMPLLPEAVITMLACAKLGAVHVAVFAGFSAKALRERIRSVGAKCVVTCDGFYRGGRVVQHKALVDEALSGEACQCVDTVVVVQRIGSGVNMASARDIAYEDLMRSNPPDAPTAVLDADAPLFLLHTSGTSGAPKAVVHGHGGYMVGAARTFDWVFDTKPTDIFWCTADLGWITGHSYVVYAPLIAGTTTVLYEGHPLYPQADRVWNIVAKLGVTTLYTTPTLIRMLMRYGSHFPKQHDLSTLRLMGSVGEPLAPDVWQWLHSHVGGGQCPLLDTWWQTETGMVMASPLPVSLLKPGTVNRPLPGVEMQVVDDAGQSAQTGEAGHLVVSKPWPSMMLGLWNDPQACQEVYWKAFPGLFATGDAARTDEDGYLRILGRTDEVINIAGHNLGTAEIEAALLEHKAVDEVAVIGVPDKIKGAVAKAFVVLAQGVEPAETLGTELKTHLRREMGPVAVLRGVEFRESLPRNQAGKIVRRVLLAEELGEDAGDASTLASGPLLPPEE